MKKRSARLGFAAAIWLVLSVAVFGTLIGIAWMSMNATVDVSTDAIMVDSVDEADSLDTEFVHVRGGFYDTPAQFTGPVDEADSLGTGFAHVKGDYYNTPARFIGPSEYPIAPGYLRDS